MSANRTRSLALFFGSIAFVAIFCALCAAWWVRSHPVQRSDDEAHRWFHRHFHLTAEQDRLLEPTERRFAEAQAKAVAEIRAANRDLASAIKADGKYSTAVEAAIERISRAQAELQKATIRHCLEMKEHLTPEQAKGLLDMMASALSDPPE